MSEISWMFPKILRMRRELVDWPALVAGASIALVAIVFPALEPKPTRESGARLGSPALGRSEFGALPPVLLSNSFGPCAGSGPVPERTGKAPGRTSPCGGAVYLSDEADIILFPAL